MAEVYPTENDTSYIFNYLKKEKARECNRKENAKNCDWDTDMFLPGEAFDVDDDGGYGPEEKAPYHEAKSPEEENVEYVDNEEDLYKD